ncbi:YkgJ family cysteine cluster protein [Natrialbaceae archaeon AArc-T1-2]|uniref:YkgJ family cysteine cluster protein n=1 Tax=Natrialbaceae archaeon AArc-T1-2 TaxID=3053904 RepID=UPI00255B3E32|nr:YkgJ family cysteine cluster protein [Natrialbaceae archaeon AArc-T1-2]WIV66695.1 YkgJ family cysteine cluster protein [Natrialbaceae archaeon AArc-T1-2]
MEVHCEGCAGCCIDWRPLRADDARAVEHERRGPREPLDDAYNLVPLTRDEVRAFLEAGLSDALTPRLWAAEEDDAAAEIDGQAVATIAGRPAFFVGLRTPPKPVAPFGRDRERWLETCTFLDPTTLQCRIHGDELFPDECRAYPAYNLALEQETECERVERVFGGERLREDDPGQTDGLLLGRGAVGGKVFVHPRPDDLEGVVSRIARGDLTDADRAEFVAVAAASSPGTLAISEHHYEQARERVLETDSWAGRAVREWQRRDAAGEEPEADLAVRLEDARGAPGTPGWDGR